MGGGSADGYARVLVRALGPSQRIRSPRGAPGSDLGVARRERRYHCDQRQLENDDQTQQSQEAEVRATTIAPTNDLESAIVATLRPGSSTAIVRGKNNSTGVARVELYIRP